MPEEITNTIPNQESVIPAVGVSRQIFPQQQEEEKEIKMAEVDTTMLSQQIGAEACSLHRGQGDIRREQAVGFGDTRYDIASEHCKTNDIVRQEGQENVMATKDARDDISNVVVNSGDRVSDRLMELRGLTGQRFHEVSHDLATVLQGQATLERDVELHALKTQLDAAKNTTYLSDKITAENEKTRDLINDLKYHDLNRGLIERNTELVECHSDARRWRHDAEQNQYAAQWAQLQSQVQAFQSQLQETRQGLVNFGTMSGNAGTQAATSNNVR